MTATPGQGSATFQELQGPLLALLLEGLSIREAAENVGCAPRTIQRWLAKGRKETGGPYASFARAVDKVQGDAEVLAESEPPLTQPEFKAHLIAAVRRGSVSAMKLWNELYGEGKGRFSGQQAGQLGMDDPIDLLEALDRGEIDQETFDQLAAGRGINPFAALEAQARWAERSEGERPDAR
jgi:hypothetical protein